jgi:hypothetical protein
LKKFKKPVPAYPEKFYKKNWKSWGDFLGTGIVAKYKRTDSYLSFDDAKSYARSLHLKFKNQWILMSKLKKIPSNLPGYPSQVYKSKGWKNWPDFLGTSRKPGSRKS